MFIFDALDTDGAFGGLPEISNVGDILDYQKKFLASLTGGQGATDIDDLLGDVSGNSAFGDFGDFDSESSESSSFGDFGGGGEVFGNIDTGNLLEAYKKRKATNPQRPLKLRRRPL